MASVRLPAAFTGFMSPVEIEAALGMQRGDILQADCDRTGITVVLKEGVALPIADSLTASASTADEIFNKGLIAYKNWGALTAGQKDVVLKNILGYILRKEGKL